MANTDDIRKTGPVGLKGLSAEQQERIKQAQQSAIQTYLGNYQTPLRSTTDVQRYSPGEAMASWGTSQYDTQTDPNYLDNGLMQDTRYENQPWYDTLANGVGKMLGTAGTTFVSSLVGLPTGIATAIGEGRWSGLWDNAVTNALGDVDDWLEKNMTNYKSTEQQNAPWYSLSNLGSMNFWADDVIKNAGFTLGAAASMAVGSGSLGLLSKAFGLVNDVSKGAKMTNAAVSALFSATGEGMIEARNGVEERNKLELQRLEDALAPEKEALDEEFNLINAQYSADGDYNAYKQRMADYAARRDEFSQKMEAGKQQIEETGREMGNKILLGNQVLLTAGNMIQFGKMMSKSFNNARHAAETSAKRVRPSLVNAERVSNNIKDGYKVTGKKLGIAQAATKGIFTEGSEEMNQQWIQNTAGYTEQAKDANDYWKAKYNDGAYKDTIAGMYTLGNAISQGFKDSWGDVNQWEQFVIGGLTGMAGSYAPTKLFNQDKTKSRWNPQRYGEWSGGAYNEVKDFLNGTDEYKGYNEYKENVDALNKVLASEDFDSRTRNLIAHTYLENNKEYAAQNNDKKLWKDEDDKQAIHDIQAFLRAGKLDDLRTIYDEMGKDLSDDDIESIVKSTTEEKEVDGKKVLSGPFFDGNNKVKTNDEIREEIRHNSDELNRKLDSYLDSVDYVNKRTAGQLTNDQEDNLAYLHNMSKESLNRADKIMANVRQQMPKKFLLKTNKTPEQLAKENTSSDLTFHKDENTREGYVEVDTSLMNDRAFSDFFLRNVLWGGNIRPEFGETADEKAAREEEEKGLNEEERKKRRTAKWKKALDDAKNDAQEQNNTNVDLMVQNFLDNYRETNRGTQAEASDALNEFLGDIADASELMQQAGEYARTLEEYLRNPEKVDQAKAKEEKKAEKKNAEEQAMNKFGGKTAKDINQDIASGNLSDDDLDDFIGADLSDVTDEDSKQALEAAKQEAQKSKDIRQKQAEIKEAILRKADEEGYNDASVDAALNAVDTMAANAEDAADINLDNLENVVNPEDYQAPTVGTSEAEDLAQQVADLVSGGLNSWKESEDKRDDIPDPSTAVSFTESEDTGHDATTKVPSETAVPKVNTSQNSDEWEQPIPTNTLSSGALDTIVEELRKTSEEPAKAGTWRSTTRRYGRRRNAAGKWYATNSPYHELPEAKDPKRSKAIWEYLNAQGAFDRVENAGEDRIRASKTKIHFMVKNFANEIFGKDYEELTEDEKPRALVILMLDDKDGAVLGDLPLAQDEPTYGKPNETPQVKELRSTQEMLFKAFEEKRKETGCNEAIADKTLQKDGVENLGLTFNNRTKSPFMSEVSQVLNGTVPFGSEVNTLNDVIGSENLLLGVSVTGETIATSKDKKDRRGSSARPTRVGNVGQPYLLLPSASGALIPVPFYTKAFDVQRHQGTELYRFLTESITRIVQNALNRKTDLDTYKEDIDIIQALLQVRAQEGARNIVDVKNDQVTLHLQSLVDTERKIDITVPNTGNAAEMAVAIANQLNGTNINISLQFLNAKIGSKSGRTADYNKVIGEIADVNLPKNTTHTKNNWFTIKLSTQAGTKRNEVRYQQSGVQTVDLNGRTIQINTDNFTATQIDPTTKEEIPITGDEEVNKLLAEVKASQQADKTKPFKITVDGEVRTYDPVKKEFVKTSQGTGINAGQESLNKQRDERREKARERRNEIRTFINDNIRKLNVAGGNAIIDDILNIDPTLETVQISNLIEKAFNRSPAAAKWLIEHSEFRNKLIALIRKTNSTQEVLKTSNDSSAVATSKPEENASVDIQVTSSQQLAQEAVSFNNPEVDDILSITPKSDEEKQAEVNNLMSLLTHAGQTTKTIEDVNKEVNEAGIINRRNQDSWDAIPDSLKLKMANEGIGIVLEYGSEKVTLDYRNFDDMKEKLKDANKYAKSGSLTVSEGAKYRRAKSEREKKADIQKERRWLQRNLPMFNTEERLHLLHGLLEIPGEENWAWGRFEKGIITLSDMAARGTLYHEAFHAVTQTLLSDEELDNLYEAAVKHYNEKNVALVEELLAEDFRKYVQRGETPIVGPILKFFRRILNAIRNISGYRAPIHQLFYRINNGEFSESIPRNVRSGNAFYSLAKNYYIDKKDPMVQYIINDGISRGLRGQDKDAIVARWKKFVEYWKGRGYRPVGHWNEKTNNFDITGVMLNEDYNKWKEAEYMKEAKEYAQALKEYKERQQALQAKAARREMTQWNRLTPAQQNYLMNDGMSEDVWENLSLTEREQWIACRG